MATFQPTRRRLKHALVMALGVTLLLSLPVTGDMSAEAQQAPSFQGSSGLASQPGLIVEVEGETLRIRSVPGGTLPSSTERLDIFARSSNAVSVQVADASLGRQREVIHPTSALCDFNGQDPGLLCQLPGRISLLDADLSAMSTGTNTNAWWHPLTLHFNGGSGPDSVQAGLGNDRIFGGPGDDRLSGGPGDDLIVGGPGVDWLEGEEGKDHLYARDGEADQLVKCSDYGDHADPRVPYDFAEWDETLDSPELCQDLLPDLEKVRDASPPRLASLAVEQPGAVAISHSFAWIGGLNEKAFRVDIATGRRENLTLGRGAYFFADAQGLWALKEGTRDTDPWTIRELDPVTGSVNRVGRACSGSWPWDGPAVVSNAQYMMLACPSGSVQFLDRSTLSLSKSVSTGVVTRNSYELAITGEALWVSGMKREVGRKVRSHVARIDLLTHGVTQLPAHSCRMDNGSQYESGVMFVEEGSLWCSSGQFLRISTLPGSIIEREFLPAGETSAATSVNGHLFLVGRDGDAWDRGWRLVIFNLRTGSLVWKSPLDFDANKLGYPHAVNVSASDLWIASHNAVSRYSLSGLPGVPDGAPVVDAPGPVRQLSIRPLPGQLFVDWDPPTSGKGASVTHYEYQVQGAPWRRASATHVLITRGVDASRVLVKVRAHSISAFGPESSQSASSLPARAPSSVSGLTARALKCGARFDWAPPRHWGGATPQHYEYSVTIGNREFPWAKARLRDPSVEWKDCSIRGKDMEIVVRAVNSAGLKSQRLAWDAVFVPKRPPKPIKEEPKVECPLRWYYIEQALLALFEGNVFDYLRLLDLARKVQC